MIVRVKASIKIKKTPAEIFTYLKDLNYHYLWNPTLQNVQPISMLKKGTAYETTSLILGVKVHGKNIVTVFIPNKELEIENNIGTIRYKVSYLLTGSRDETQIVCHTTINNEHKGFAFSAHVLKLLIKRELHSDLEALRLAAEQSLNYSINE